MTMAEAMDLARSLRASGGKFDLALDRGNAANRAMLENALKKTGCTVEGNIVTVPKGDQPADE